MTRKRKEEEEEDEEGRMRLDQRERAQSGVERRDGRDERRRSSMNHAQTEDMKSSRDAHVARGNNRESAVC